jgi:hypothetical protein
VGGTRQFFDVFTFSDSSTKVISPAQSWAVSGGSAVGVTYVTGGSCGHVTATSEPCPSSGSISLQIGDTVVIAQYVAVAPSGFYLPSDIGSLNALTFACPTSQSHLQLCVAKATKTGTDVVTVSQINSGTFGAIWAQFRNATGIDPGTANGVSAFNSGAATTAVTTPTFTTAGGSDALWCAAWDGGAASDFAVGAGYTLIALDSHSYAAAEYEVGVAANSSNVGTFTDGSSTATWQVGCIPFTSATASNASINATGGATGLVAGSTTVFGNSYNEVQVSSSNNCLSSGTPSVLTCPFSGQQSLNDTNVIAVGWHDTTATISSVADAAGNSYTLATSVAANGVSLSIYKSQGIAAFLGNTVTVTFSGAATKPDIRLLEGMGMVGGLDSGGTGSASSSAAICSPGSLNNTNAYDVAVGFVFAGGTVQSIAPLATFAYGPDSNGGSLFALPTFAANALTAYSATSTAGPCAMGVVSFKTKGATAALTVSSTVLGTYSLQNPPPVTTEFYPGTIFTTPLPGNVGNDCLGQVVCGSSADIANGLTIVSNAFGGSIANAATMVITTSPVIQTGVDGHTLYYCDVTCPIYQFVGASGVKVPATPSNNPTGVFFHLPDEAQFSSESSDQFLNVWDQSSDIDSIAGGRIFSIYNYNGGTPGILYLPGHCTCTTTSCASTTSACQIKVGSYAEYDHPFNDPTDYNVSAGAYASSHFGPGTGIVRQLEWSSGTIDHALILNANCMNQFTPTVFPSFGATTACSDGSHLHVSNGSLLWIDASYNCSTLPAWQQPFCVAMQTYGGYVVDSGGVGATGGFYDSRIENGVAWTVADLTQPAPIFTYLNGAGSTNGLACSGSPVNKCTFTVFNMPGLLGHLHVIDSCIPERMAGQPGAC